MAYPDFTLEGARKAFGLTFSEVEDLFCGLAEVVVGDRLGSILEEYVPLATAALTEKIRSELIVAPLLLEARRLVGRRIGFFSGIEFNVDAAQGLTGFCDFLLTKSPGQFVVMAPVLTIVEAKNDDLKAGMGQCVAEMVAARLFNEREGHGPTTIYGATTTGTNWRFLRLEGDLVTLDLREYLIDQAGMILAILLHCVGGGPEPAAAPRDRLELARSTT